MSPKLPRHQDLDSQILDLGNDPLKLFWQLTRLAIYFFFIAAWLGLAATMIIGWLSWSVWPYLWLPLMLILSLLIVPAAFTARQGAMAMLNAIALSGEAWLARAKHSISLNQSSARIGYIRVESPEVRTPVIYNSPQGTRLLAKDAPDMLGIEPEPTIERRLWELPNKVKVPQETLEEFTDQVFVRGWSRAEWVNNGAITREVHDGLIQLFEAVKLIDGRKKGYAGKLTVKNARQARMVLNLPL